MRIFDSLKIIATVWFLFNVSSMTHKCTWSENKLIFHYTYFRTILRTCHLMLTAQINPIELIKLLRRTTEICIV